MYHGLRAVSHYTSVLLLLVVECVTCVHDQGVPRHPSASICTGALHCTAVNKKGFRTRSPTGI